MNFPLLIFFLGFVAIFVFRIPIALGMLTTATLYMFAKGLDIGLVADQVLSNLFSKYIIMAVPLLSLPPRS